MNHLSRDYTNISYNCFVSFTLKNLHSTQREIIPASISPFTSVAVEHNILF